MILIIGLGNPGEKYENTRHNLGFMAVDDLAKKLLSLEKTSWENNSKSNSFILKINSKLLLVKPQTLMNASGRAVARLARYYKVKSEEIWVIHDDLDLTLGKIKIRKGGGSAGHRGIDSIVKELGVESFIRFRLGIGHPRKEAEGQKHKDIKSVDKYVLSEFNSKEKTEAKKMIKKTVKAIQLALEKGIEPAMNRFN